MALLLKWNDAMNLTAIQDPLEILYRHFCESMFGASLIPAGGGRLADVGSGGGFPGLPLKIARPDLEVCLIDSNVKKATFLAEVVRELALPRARVLVSRYEELDEEVAPLDIACSRAVGEFAQFLKWAASERIGAEQSCSGSAGEISTRLEPAKTGIGMSRWRFLSRCAVLSWSEVAPIKSASRR